MQQNIYFRKNVWEKLKDEEDKSKLINELLNMHYEGELHTFKWGNVKQVSEEIANPFKGTADKPATLDNPNVIKTPAQVKVKENIFVTPEQAKKIVSTKPQFTGFITKQHSARKKSKRL